MRGKGDLGGNSVHPVVRTDGMSVRPCGGTEITHPVWIIVVTITDKATGERIEERELDSELRFDDRSESESIVARVSTLSASDFFASVLTCRNLTSM
jgi:hypothetical protein